MGCLPHNGAPIDWSSRDEVGRLPEGSAVEGVLINLYQWLHLLSNYMHKTKGLKQAQVDEDGYIH